MVETLDLLRTNMSFAAAPPFADAVEVADVRRA